MLSLVSAIKPHTRIEVASLRPAPSLPSLKETSPVEQRVKEKPTPIKNPAPPIPPPRKERQVRPQSPPPSYSVETTYAAAQTQVVNEQNYILEQLRAESSVNLKEVSPVFTKVVPKPNENINVQGKNTEDDIDTPPPLPASGPPLEDPKPWFEIEEELVDETVSITSRTSNYKVQSASTKRLSSLELPALPPNPKPRQSPINLVKGMAKPTTPPSPSVIKIGDTTPPAIQKTSKMRSFFGLGSPTASPEPPKPKARRIRVPKQKSPKNSPKPLPRTLSTASSTEQINVADNKSTIQQERSIEMNGDQKKPSVTPEPPARKVKQNGEAKSAPKQLSFAETATVFSEDEEVHSLNEEQDTNDSWDLVARHRAKINQNAHKVKANGANVRLKAAQGTEKRVEFVPVDKPKTMREMRKSQSTGAGINLKNKDQRLDSDTEA